MVTLHVYTEKQSSDIGHLIYMNMLSNRVQMLTICCSDVQKTATQAQRRPFALISTSVTVQIPTPKATTATATITRCE